MAGRKAAPAADPETARPANAHRGEISLTLDGQELVLRPSFEAIDAFEALTGKGLMELARDALEGRLRLGQTAQIATECIRAWGRATGSKQHQGVNSTRIAGLILESEGGYQVALKTIAGLLAMAVTGNYSASGEVKAGTATTTTTENPAES